LAAESLANVKFIQEKKLISKYFDEISQDTGRFCFGVNDTLKGLELGAVETLIVWENLDITRYVLKSSGCEYWIEPSQIVIELSFPSFSTRR
jgi:peptide chain release factor subunit 1